jgi:hypothetical protein
MTGRSGNGACTSCSLAGIDFAIDPFLYVHASKRVEVELAQAGPSFQYVLFEPIDVAFSRAGRQGGQLGGDRFARGLRGVSYRAVQRRANKL